VTRILIIKPSALGDVATTLPLLCDLKTAVPDAQIDWLIHPANLAVIEHHDALHQVILFDRKKLASWWYNPASFLKFRKLLKTLRENRYDVVIDAQGLLRSGFLSFMTRAKTHIGFAHAREGARWFYTHKIRLARHWSQMIAVDRMRALGEPLGTSPAAAADFRAPISDTAAARATELLGTIPTNERLVILIPGARWDTKRWPVDRYSQLASRLLAEHDRLILLGSSDEKPLCDQIEASASNEAHAAEPASRILNLAGKTDIATMIAILARADLVVGNDSGPIHIAAALGRPLLALHGPTAPSNVGPHGPHSAVLRHEVPCHPCRRRTCSHHSCMQGLTVELVWKNAKRNP